MKEIKASNNMVGYIWKSNRNCPGTDVDSTIVNGRFDGLTLTDGENPFCIEANLFDKDTNKSYTVRYVDGKYYLSAFDVSDEELKCSKDNLDYREYILNRSENRVILRFIQRWRAGVDNDDSCLGMEVLKPQELVFIGFNDKEDNK